MFTSKIAQACSVFVALACLAGFSGAQTAPKPAGDAKAFDLNGAWSTSADACQSVFAKNGATIVFKKDSELYGSGFVVDGNEIRGSGFKCAIKARRHEAATVHLLASCATQIMVDQMQISYKVLDADRISRIFPGFDTYQETTFSRCSFKGQ